MNRPFSAFGILLGFLALTMFAVSSTSRSTTVKPAANYADRATIRRQAMYSRLSAVAAAADAGEVESFGDDALCVPGSFDIETASINPATSDGRESLQPLRGPATSQLTPVQVEAVGNSVGASEVSLTDGPTNYDFVYDRVVLGVSDIVPPAAELAATESRRELSAAEVTSLFQSLLPEKSSGSRNAVRKSQRRATLESDRLPLSAIVPAFQNWLSQQAERLSSESTPAAGVDWADYADLMDEATGHSNASAVAVGISDAE